MVEPNSPISDVIQTIEMHRKRKYIKQADIAASVGISAKYYRQLRDGKAPNVAFSVVIRLLRAVDVDILLFFPANKPNI